MTITGFQDVAKNQSPSVNLSSFFPPSLLGEILLKEIGTGAIKQERIAYLVAQGAPVNFERSGDTPLVLAVLWGHSSTADLLLNNGGNLHHKYYGKTLFELAQELEHKDTLAVLRRHDAQSKACQPPPSRPAP
jgi:ankyrin repeat protein